LKKDKLPPESKRLLEAKPRHANAPPGESVDPDPIYLAQTYEARFPLAELEPHPANPNEADLGELHTLIDTNGFYGAILVQSKTPDGERRNRILAGHGRYQTLVQKGRKYAPVFLVIVDDEKAARILLGDNASRDKASTNEETLSRVLQMLNATTGSLKGTAYDTNDLQDVLARLNGKQGAREVNEFTKAGKDESAGWPIIQIRCPADVLELFTEEMRHCSGDKPWQKLKALLTDLAQFREAAPR
jgi:hypothetical protein